MSQRIKKGKTLTTKSQSNKSDKVKKIQQDFGINSAIFDSFVRTRTSKHQDDSLLSIYSSDSVTMQESDTDVFKSPNNSRDDKIFLETTISPQNKIFEETTKMDIFMSDSSSKSKLLLDEKFNDSSLFFEGNSKQYFAIKDNNTSIAKDNCKTSKEDNTKDITLDDDFLIPKVPDVQKPKPTTTDENLPEVEDSDSGDKNQCPVCLKTIAIAKYLSHMKSCAAKHKLSTQQLLSALKLHKKQLAERKEIGLGFPVQQYKAKVSPKRTRTNDKKLPADSGLQLALALSASLQSAQEDEVIQEAEALKEAGLCMEAEQKLSTLEKFGFASALPLHPKTSAGGSKSHSLPPSLLLRRNQEDRERIITEKVAIILINEGENMDHTSFISTKPILKYKILEEKLNHECQLWNMARCSEDEKREVFYVKSLSQFVSPFKGEIGEGLRRLSQLPGRLNTPMKEDINDESITPCKSFTEMEKIDISDLPTLRSDVVGIRKINSTVLNYKNSGKCSASSLSEDWGKLVNNNVLSDIKIQCKDSVVIPAHKLVFYARCPSILNEVVKKENSESVLDWQSCTVNSVVAFLEFLYCGRIDKVLMLDSNDFQAVKSLADRLDYTELRNHLRGAKNHASESKKREVKKKLFELDNTNNSSGNIVEHLDSNDKRLSSDLSITGHVPKNNCEKIASVALSSLSGENVSNGRESPDMFGDQNETYEIEAQEERDDLDVLVSLLGKPTQYKVISNKKCNSFETGEIMAINSPPGLSTGDIFPGKRKALNTSFSDDEDNSLSKKHCSDMSQNDFLESQNTEETFDLTQSSHSSNEEALENGKRRRNTVEGSDNNLQQSAISETKNKESTFDLTQSSKSSNEEVFKERKCDSPVDSDTDVSLVDLTQKYCDESIPNNCEKSQTINKDFVDPIWNEYSHEDCNYSAKRPKMPPVKIVEDKSKSDIITLSAPQFNQSKVINSPKNNSILVFSDMKSSPDQLSHNTLNISSRKGSNDISLQEDNVQDYIDPVWEGYDDYFHFDCASNFSLKTPMKYQKDESFDRKSLPASYSFEKFKHTQGFASAKNSPLEILSEKKSPRKFSQSSPSITSPKSITSISYNIQSPRVISQNRLTPQSSSTIKSISSDSRSPKCFSQNMLGSDSPKQKYGSKELVHNLTINESLVELLPERNSMGSLVCHKTNLQKTRKNLSSQFESDSGCSEYKRNNSINNTPLQLASNSESNLAKSSLRKDSLAAMQRLLDDSFEVNDSLFDTADALALGDKGEEQAEKEAGSTGGSPAQDDAKAGTSRSKMLLDTPSPGIIVSDKITPLPDYSGMKTPGLKKELSKFGLKPSLGRRKAKLLLRYIYDQTHPVMPDSDNQEHLFKQPEGQPPRSPMKIPRKINPDVQSPRKTKTSLDSPRKTQITVNLDDSGSELDEPCSQMSTSSSISSSASLPEESYHEAEDNLTQDISHSGDMHSCIRSLIIGNPELHRKVLLYEPIFLEDLMAMLKASGIRSKANDVMDFLDEQCITFRTNGWKATNEKRRQKQKSTKKKVKPRTTGTSDTSPSKGQTQVAKKRGRPKKTDK